MTSLVESGTLEIKRLAPESFKELMAAIITLAIVTFYLAQVTMGRETPDMLNTLVGASVGIWVKIA